MSEIKVIGISVISPSAMNLKIEELVTLTIERTAEGKYCVAEGEKEVIDILLFEILENAQFSSTTFLAVEIPRRREGTRATPPQPSSEARRRRRRRPRPSGGAA